MNVSGKHAQTQMSQCTAMYKNNWGLRRQACSRLVDTCWSLVAEQHNSPNSTSSTYKIRNGPNKARLARPVYPIWMLQSLEKRAQAIPCTSLHLFEMSTENSMNALPQPVCSISICARSDRLQVKNDDYSYSCHRFWHRCWYCKLRWLSLLKLKGPLLDAATEVCGLFENQQWKPETWCWNEEVAKLYKRSMHSSRLTVPWRKIEAWWRRPRGQ